MKYVILYKLYIALMIPICIPWYTSVSMLLAFSINCIIIMKSSIKWKLYFCQMTQQLHIYPNENHFQKHHDDNLLKFHQDVNTFAAVCWSFCHMSSKIHHLKWLVFPQLTQDKGIWAISHLNHWIIYVWQQKSTWWISVGTLIRMS